ncbi:MAG: hypothetical protein JOY62_01820 [Acidobacteriaceae bacterium]|nr:hypothetical protein [Acidobacteriaceae bacterium]
MRQKCISFFTCAAVALCASALWGQEDSAKGSQPNVPRLKVLSWHKAPPKKEDVEAMKNLAANNSSKSLPLWTLFTEASRDDNGYSGVMVGRDPFNGGGGVNVATYIVPLKITTHQIAVSVNSKGILTNKPGKTVFDPTATDKACLGSSNNVPATLFEQSPIFKNTNFDFGGTIVGDTQYVDAFQRGNFWQVEDRDHYHVLLGPVKTLKAIDLDVPVKYGTALATTALGPPAFCAPMAIVDIGWFDTWVANTLIPALSSQGVNPSNLPIVFVHNVVWSIGPPELNDCCAIGYHSWTGYPLQTYSSINFDYTDLFGPAILDTAVASHEVAEWMNDPFGNNPTPGWSAGQATGFCQTNLEVGDPLTGTEAPRIAMSNGFTYHLQELAFFSWFFGSPSVGIHNWFSNNGTFLTDAGPPCM